MKKLLSLLLVCLPLIIFSQDKTQGPVSQAIAAEFDQLTQEIKTELNKKNFNSELLFNKLRSARVVARERRPAAPALEKVDRLFTRFYRKLEQQKNNALLAEAQVRRLLDTAELAKLKALEAEREARRIAVANRNAARLEKVARKNPTLALQMAGFILEDNTENPSVLSAFHDLISDTAQVFYNKELKTAQTITDLALSLDGSRILTGTASARAILWDQSGSVLDTLAGHGYQVTAVAFLGDHKMVTGDYYGRLVIWNQEGVPIDTLVGHKARITDIKTTRKQEIITTSQDRMAILWGADGQAIDTLSTNRTGILSVAISKNGERIFTGHMDKKIIQWERGIPTDTLLGHTGYIYALEFSADERMLLSASSDKTARLWDLSKQSYTTFTGHSGAINTACFSPDGLQVLTGSSDRTIKLWDLKGNELQTFEEDLQAVRGLAFAPDGRHFYSAESSKARLWNLIGLELTNYNYERLNGAALSVAFIPATDTTERMLISGSRDHSVRIWDQQDTLQQEFNGHQLGVEAVAYCPQFDYVLSGSMDGTAILWDRQNKTKLKTFQHRHVVEAVAFSPNGQNCITGSWDSTAIIWPIYSSSQSNIDGDTSEVSSYPTEADSVVLKGHQGYVEAAIFSPKTGSFVVTGSQDQKIIKWSLSGEILESFIAHQDDVEALAISKDEKLLLSGSKDSTAILWNLENGEVIKQIRHKAKVWSVAFSPTSNDFTIATADNIAYLYNQQGDERKAFYGHQGDIEAVAFSPDGKSILTASWDNTIKLWDVETAEDIQSLRISYITSDTATAKKQEFAAGINDAALSPNGKYVVSVSDKVATLWSVEGNEEESLTRHQQKIKTVAFSPDSKYILTGSQDKSAILWKTNGEFVKSFSHGKIVNDVAFSPDGKHFATSSQDYKVRIWSLDGLDTAPTILSNSPRYQSITFSTDRLGQYLVGGTSDGYVDIWDWRNNTKRQFRYQRARINAIAMSPDNHQILIGAKGVALLWDTMNLQTPVARFEGHDPDRDLHSVAFSPDGQYIITTSGDHTAKVWDLKGHELTTIYHDGAVTAGQFSRKQDRILTAAKDGQAKLWFFWPTFLEQEVAQFPISSFLQKGLKVTDSKMDLLKGNKELAEISSIADYLYQQKQWDSAWEFYETAIEIAPSRDYFDKLYNIAAKTEKYTFNTQHLAKLPTAAPIVYYAKKYLSLKDTTEALSLYKMAMDKPGAEQYLASYYKIASAPIRQGLYQMMLKQEKASVLASCGATLMQLKENKQAYPLYKKANQLTPKDANILKQLYHCSKKLTEHEFDLKLVLLLEQGKDIAYFANQYSRSKDTATTVLLYDAAIKIDPQQQYFQYRYRHTKDSTEQNKFFETMLDIKDHRTLSGLGDFFNRTMRDQDKAYPLYHKASRQAPSNYQYLSALFELAEKTGKEFNTDWCKSLASNREVEYFATGYFNAKDWVKSKILFELAFEKKEEPKYLIKLFEIGEKHEAADFDFKRMVNLEEAKGLLAIGKYFTKRKTDMAIKRAKQLFEKGFKLTEEANFLIELHGIANTSASSYYERMLQLKEDKELAIAGRYFSYKKDWASARELYLRAAVINPQQINHHVDIFRMEEKIGSGPADIDINRVLALDDLKVLSEIARREFTATKWTEIQFPFYERIVQLTEAYENQDSIPIGRLDIVRNYNNLGYYQIMNRQFKEADSSFAKAHELNPQDVILMAKMPFPMILTGHLKEAKQFMLKKEGAPFTARTNRFSSFRSAFIFYFNFYGKAFIKEKDWVNSYKLLDAATQMYPVSTDLSPLLQAMVDTFGIDKLLTDRRYNIMAAFATDAFIKKNKEQSEKWYKEAVELAEKQLQEEANDRLLTNMESCYNNLGYIQFFNGHFPAAEKSILRGIEVGKSASDEDDIIYTKLPFAYLLNEQLAQADSIVKDLQTRKLKLPHDSYRSFDASYNYYSTKLIDHFIAEQNWKVTRILFDKFSEYYPTDRNTSTYASQVAKAFAKEELTTLKVANGLLAIASYYIRQKRYEDASSFIDLAKSKATVTADSTKLSQLLYELGNSLLKQKKYAWAASKFQESLLFDSTYADSRRLLPLALLLQGKTAEATAIYLKWKDEEFDPRYNRLYSYYFKQDLDSRQYRDAIPADTREEIKSLFIKKKGQADTR